ncbi:MAG TPA: cell wall-binding repeat-containing protein, partial [Solirubrobacterales bacterium]
PAVLKGIAGLVVLAVVFIAAAILGGGSSEEPSADSPAPVGGRPAPGEDPAGKAPAELGYPAFVTSNTTRVGGPEPASNAAGVALAVYPAVGEAQRPPAVVLVDGNDWQGGVAASVLMAAPLGAPLLIAEGDELPDPTGEALDALDPQGGAESGGAAAFAIGDAAAPDGLATKRVVGADPAATAAAIARLRDRLFERPPQHLVIASATDAAFALPAAAWAARSGDPVLFAGRDALPKATAAALRQYRNVPVYVLGPSSAISSSVVRQIAEINGRVRRVSGETPVENAIALARYSDGSFGWNVNDPGHGFVVARADSPLDAIAAAPLSASGTWGPLLLTDSADTLPAALRGYLLDVKPGYTTDPTRAFYNHVWVIGDEVAIDVSQQAEIDELAELAKIGGES